MFKGGGGSICWELRNSFSFWGGKGGKPPSPTATHVRAAIFHSLPLPSSSSSSREGKGRKKGQVFLGKVGKEEEATFVGAGGKDGERGRDISEFSHSS